jgi:WD repeat-containing protein 26
LASCGSDKQVIIWEVPSFKVLHSLKEHEQGVGNVAWSWDDTMLVTCSRDRYARLWDVAVRLILSIFWYSELTTIQTGKCLRKLSRFDEPVSSCVWSPDNESFLTGSLDKEASLIQWDLFGERIYEWAGPPRIEELALSPNGRWLVAMDTDRHIHVYNYETREFEYKLDLKSRLTSLSISQNSRHLLVNQTNGYAQLIDLVLRTPVQQYTGHLGGDYVIRASLGGADELFVITGSEGKSPTGQAHCDLSADQRRWLHKYLEQIIGTMCAKNASPQP